MIIRRLTPADIAEHRRFRLVALRESPDAFGSSYAEAVRQPDKYFENRLEVSANNWVIGCFVEKTLIGVLRLVRDEVRKERHKASIYGMYVAASERRKGVAHHLLEAALTIARKLRGIRQVRLSVVTTNKAAVAFYRGAGFSVYGKEEDSLLKSGRFDSEFLMVKKIRQHALKG